MNKIVAGSLLAVGTVITCYAIGKSISDYKREEEETEKLKADLEDIDKSFAKTMAILKDMNDRLEADIMEAEDELRSKGMTDEELEAIKRRVCFQTV